MPTPSKGDRRLVTTRIPADYFEKLTEYATTTGTTKSDFLGDVLLAALDRIDLAAIHQSQDQARLPMSA